MSLQLHNKWLLSVLPSHEDRASHQNYIPQWAASLGFCLLYTSEKAVDENVRTWWSATSGKAGEYFVMDLSKKIRMNSIQINFAEQDINPDAPKETDYHAYKLYVSDNGRDWKLIVDKSKNTVAIPHEYVCLLYTSPVRQGQ